MAPGPQFRPPAPSPWSTFHSRGLGLGLHGRCVLRVWPPPQGGGYRSHVTGTATFSLRPLPVQLCPHRVGAVTSELVSGETADLRVPRTPEPQPFKGPHTPHTCCTLTILQGARPSLTLGWPVSPAPRMLALGKAHLEKAPLDRGLGPVPAQSGPPPRGRPWVSPAPPASQPPPSVPLGASCFL